MVFSLTSIPQRRYLLHRLGRFLNFLCNESRLCGIDVGEGNVDGRDLLSSGEDTVSTNTNAAGVTVESGVERLYRREFEPMYRLAFAMLGSDADADEVVQDAFVGVARKWRSLESPGGYLRVSVINGVRKKMRSQSRRDQAVASLSVVVPDAAPSGGEYLLDALGELPERQRVAVVLTYFSGLRSSEVGELMECPAATVRSLLHRALEQLREVMDR